MVLVFILVHTTAAVGISCTKPCILDALLLYTKHAIVHIYMYLCSLNAMQEAKRVMESVVIIIGINHSI